ncbi:spirocyclase AveC family protein [Streptomyces sp. SAJ15]|uniref:spirocyclase AveC family protein n=1 Tax=Streptomyces sp. SAJ15 TaxID=2011095 RepID=UPI001643679F|nr:spirocyclase AveC family protein [Streptomyces sp. SAJ15]
MSSHQASVPDAGDATTETQSPSPSGQKVVRVDAGPSSAAPGRRGRRVPPVVVWACLGVFFVVLQTYVLVSWLVDGTHIDKAPETSGFGTTMEVIGVLVPLMTVVPVVVLTVKFVRESRAQRRATFDLLLVIGCVLSAWQDPLLNWFHPVITVNTNQFMATSSWAPYVPGWQGPGEHQQAEMPWHALVAGLGTALSAIVVGAGVQWLAKRRPGIRPIRLAGFAVLLGMLLTATSEPFLPALGFFIWSGATPELTLFSGTWYQFPVYELVTAGTYFAALAMLRLAVNERGETLAERGVGELSWRRTTWLRLLAVAGVTNVAYVGYAVGHMLFAWNHGSPPIDLPDFFRPPAAY